MGDVAGEDFLELYRSHRGTRSENNAQVKMPEVKAKKDQNAQKAKPQEVQKEDANLEEFEDEVRDNPQNGSEAKEVEQREIKPQEVQKEDENPVEFENEDEISTQPPEIKSPATFKKENQVLFNGMIPPPNSRASIPLIIQVED